jgi:hypothetical protein
VEPQRRSRRVVIHVGAPKTGTTFLQQTLWNHRSSLLEQGVTCPGSRERDMFHAAVEVREAFGFWGLDPETLTGTWQRMCRDARAFDGTTVMTHELLGGATTEQVERALAELADEHVEIVLTTRDLARQVTSEWQERLKNGGTRSFKTFRRRIAREIRDGDFTSSFWRAQDPVGVLDRWAVHLPANRVHVVVCPPSGGAAQELWHRFGEACGFDATAVDPSAGGARSNKRLGVVEASILRKVNKELDGRIPQPQYSAIVKHQFAQRTLTRLDSPGPRCPAALVAQLRSVAEQRNEVLRARGYTIHGDLDELVPAEADGPAADPDAVDARREVDACVAVIAEMLVDRAERSQRRPAAVAAIVEQAREAPARGLLRRAVRLRRDGGPRRTPH